jgi:hypothetical protein
MTTEVFKSKPCVICGKVTEMKLSKEKVDRWQAGEHIQNVFPELSAMQRETMISGVCSDEHWDKLFGIEPDEDDSGQGDE